jgi:chromosome segregation ATPase
MESSILSSKTSNIKMQSIIDNLQSNITSLQSIAAETSEGSSVLTGKLNKARQKITRKKSKINIQKKIIANLEGVKEGLESDVAYLVDQQKYSSLASNKLEKANKTIQHLQSIIQSQMPRDHSAESLIKQQIDEIASLKQQLFDSYAVYLSSQVIASSLPSLESKTLSTTLIKKKRSSEEISESIADDTDSDTDDDYQTCRKRCAEEIKESIDDCNTDDDNYCGLQHSISASIKSKPTLCKMLITPQHFSYSSKGPRPSSSSSSSSSSFSFDEIKNTVDKTNSSNKEPRRTSAVSPAEFFSQKR